MHMMKDFCHEENKEIGGFYFSGELWGLDLQFLLLVRLLE